LSQAEQSKFLGRGDEVVSNLGHPSREDDLTRHPLGKVVDYTNHASEGVVRGPPRSQGVYGRFRDPQSGISSEQNLDRWAGYARSNSYGGKDPKGRGAGSDGHLASTKNWPSFEYGSESGLGRIEKARK
jgi:hypothetical protein